MQLHKRRGVRHHGSNSCNASSSYISNKSSITTAARRLAPLLLFLLYACWFLLSTNAAGNGHPNGVASYYYGVTTTSSSDTSTILLNMQQQQHPHQEGHPHPQQHKSYYPPYSSKPNAIIYMAQKSHKVYLRNSLALLERSLDLLFRNYLLIDDHYLNATVFIFHTGDFNDDDLVDWEHRYPLKTKGTLQLINLRDTPYWQTPAWLNEDDLATRWRSPEFNLGYRHMIRWYAIRMWDYFAEINQHVGTNYQYIMRMDEESFFHSPIPYDLFHTMATNDYEYAFRICSYEMNAIQQIMHNYTTRAKLMWGDDDAAKERNFNGANCGFYNNWFIGDLSFFQSDRVQHYLHWFDDEGFMYRDRLNDLVIQTGAVYTFLPSHKIHRFLDWTYEHFTLTKGTNCPKWGALATGYNDDRANETIATFVQQLKDDNCTIGDAAIMTRRQVPGLHVYHDAVADLSPTYNHLPASMLLTNKTLISIKAGRIDIPGRGERSG